MNANKLTGHFFASEYVCRCFTFRIVFEFCGAFGAVLLESGDGTFNEVRCKLGLGVLFFLFLKF